MLNDPPLTLPFNIMAIELLESIWNDNFDKGADIESKNVLGETPLHLACKRRNLQQVKFLTEKGANIDTKDNRGRTPLHIACKRGYLKVVKLLVKKGANIEFKDGFSPLHEAIIEGNLDIIKFLLESNKIPLKTILKNGNGIEYRNISKFYSINGLLKEYIASLKIQSFFRAITAKNVANRLRMEPDKLFDPEFSDRRKFILKIDDSSFI